MTGNPSRLALVATVPSGVMGIPAKRLGGAGSVFGAAGAGAPAYGFLTFPRCFGRFPDTLIGGRCPCPGTACPSGAAGCDTGVAVCAAPGLAAISAAATKVEDERKMEWIADSRPRSRPRWMTGNTSRPNGELRPRHRDFG